MNWPDDVVSKVADAVGEAMYSEYGYITSASYAPLGQAALSAITLQDIGKLPEVKALAEALQYVEDRNWTSGTPQSSSWINEFCDVAHKALAPFKEASNG